MDPWDSDLGARQLPDPRCRGMEPTVSDKDLKYLRSVGSQAGRVFVDVRSVRFLSKFT
jgi:hypothetical protein